MKKNINRSLRNPATTTQRVRDAGLKKLRKLESRAEAFYKCSEPRDLDINLLILQCRIAKKISKLTFDLRFGDLNEEVVVTRVRSNAAATESRLQLNVILDALIGQRNRIREMESLGCINDKRQTLGCEYHGLRGRLRRHPFVGVILDEHNETEGGLVATW